MARPPPQRAARGHVPQEDLPVAADAGEAGVVGRDGEVEHFVAVRGVGLDEAGGRGGGESAGGGGSTGGGEGGGRGFEGVVEPDGAVGGAGEDLGRVVSERV